MIFTSHLLILLLFFCSVVLVQVVGDKLKSGDTVGATALLADNGGASSTGGSISVGSVLQQWGNPAFHFSSLGGIAIDSSDTIYVSDSQNDRVIALSLDNPNPILSSFNLRSPSIGFRSPMGIAVVFNQTTAMEELLVSDAANQRLVWCGIDGSLLSVKTSTPTSFQRPVAAQYDDNTKQLYVIDSVNDELVLLQGLDSNQGIVVNDVFGTDLALTTLGSVVVANPSTRGVTFVSTISPEDIENTLIDQFSPSNPNAIHTDSNGNLYISDPIQQTLTIVDSTVTNILYTIQLEFSIGRGGIAITSDNNILLTDTTNLRVVLLQGMIAQSSSSSASSPLGSSSFASSSAAAASSISSATGGIPLSTAVPPSLSSSSSAFSSAIAGSSGAGISSSSSGSPASPVDDVLNSNGGVNLSDGQIAGIVIGVVLGVAFLVVFLWLLLSCWIQHVRKQQLTCALPLTSTKGKTASYSDLRSYPESAV